MDNNEYICCSEDLKEFHKIINSYYANCLVPTTFSYRDDTVIDKLSSYLDSIQRYMTVNCYLNNIYLGYCYTDKWEYFSFKGKVQEYIALTISPKILFFSNRLFSCHDFLENIGNTSLVTECINSNAGYLSTTINNVEGKLYNQVYVAQLMGDYSSVLETRGLSKDKLPNKMKVTIIENKIPQCNIRKEMAELFTSSWMVLSLLHEVAHHVNGHHFMMANKDEKWISRYIKTIEHDADCASTEIFVTMFLATLGNIVSPMYNNYGDGFRYNTLNSLQVTIVSFILFMFVSSLSEYPENEAYVPAEYRIRSFLLKFKHIYEKIYHFGKFSMMVHPMHLTEICSSAEREVQILLDKIGHDHVKFKTNLSYDDYLSTMLELRSELDFEKYSNLRRSFLRDKYNEN